MSTSPLSLAEREAQAERLHAVWKPPKGWRYWSEVNNDQIGTWYLATSFAFFLFAGVLALLMRVQLAAPQNGFLDAERYSQVFTLHGSVMMFLFAVPIFEAFSIRILPAMLGARDLPFPRLSAYGYWCFLIGGVFVCGSIFFDAAPQGGWFMYPPLTTQYQPGVGADVWLLGLSFIEVASIAAAVELIVGILKCRPPGMKLHLMPLYAWYLLVAAVMILFAFPPLIAGDLLFELERSFDWPFFDPKRGGDPLLWQHLFWIFGHPEVYIVFLPAVGLVAMMVPTFARVPVRGYRWIVLSALGTGFISFALWVHHMYATGMPGISLAFFSAASEAVAIPTAIQIFCLIATVLVGRVNLALPMLFCAGALAIFVLGGLTGVMVALAPFDFQVHDTYFIVAHLHYVLIGGMLFPVFGAAIYFWPLISGREASQRLGRWAFWLMFLGFNIGFLPMHATGLAGMPRRVYTYREGLGFDALNLVSTIGAFVLAFGVLLFVLCLIRARRCQSLNPWKAGTLEWLSGIPDEPWGLRSVPRVRTRYPLWQQPQIEREVRDGMGLLADAPDGVRETLVSGVIDAEPGQCLRVPGPSFKPLFAAVFTGGAFIAPVYHAWAVSVLFAGLALAVILWWLWTGTARIPEKRTQHVGGGLHLPLYVSGPSSVGWWAMFITMIGDSTAFLSLVFGYFFFWTVHADFPPPGAGPGVMAPMACATLALLAWTAMLLARRYNAAHARRAALLMLGLAAGLSLCGGVVLWIGLDSAGLDPKTHVYPATVWVLALWTLAHLALGALMCAYCLARLLFRRMDSAHDADLQNTLLYWHFLLATVAIASATLGLFPLVAR